LCATLILHGVTDRLWEVPDGPPGGLGAGVRKSGLTPVKLYCPPVMMTVVVVQGKRLLLSCATVVCSLGLWGCALLNPGSAKLYPAPPNSRVFLITDSQEVRQLLADEDAREDDVNRFYREKHSAEAGRLRIEDMLKHPELYPPGRPAFLKTMLSLPGFEIKGTPWCFYVQESKSTCDRSPIATAHYVLVQVTSGPSSGKQGWICSEYAPGRGFGY
jgi:hypothetical protein